MKEGRSVYQDSLYAIMLFIIALIQLYLRVYLEGTTNSCLLSMQTYHRLKTQVVKAFRKITFLEGLYRVYSLVENTSHCLHLTQSWRCQIES